MKTPVGLYYAETHEWVKVEEGFGYIGITDYAQHSLGEVVYVELPEVDDTVSKEGEFGAVESVKAASDLMAPVSGVVVEVNEELDGSPELINEDPYEHWMIKVALEDITEVESLMSAEEYAAFCEASDH